MNGQKNLVLGAVSGYSFEQLKPFILSLKASGFKGDICLLYAKLSLNTIAELNAHGVLHSPLVYRGSGALNSWSRFWPYVKPVVNLLGYSDITRHIMKLITPLQTSRFYNYTDYLLRKRDKYQHVLITDVRDVIFQADPFADFDKNAVQCYEEDLTLAEERHFNVGWIKSLFGEDSATPFLQEKILCSGTILGPLNKILKYLNAFELLLTQAEDIAPGGSDQGLHNYLIRTGVLREDVNIVKNATGEVLTVSAANISQYRVDFEGRFCDDRNRVIPVIHQYDRDPTLARNFEVRLIMDRQGDSSL